MRRSVWVAGLVVSLAGCTASLPLGGVAPGRGQPIGRGALFHVGYGDHAELAGTLPEVFDASGVLVNPVPRGDSLSTLAGGFDLGVTAAVVDWFDVGFSRARGLHAMVRLAGGDRWSWSVSPAWYRYSTQGSENVYASPQPAGVDALNVTSVVAVLPPLDERARFEVYAGAGFSDFDTRLGRDDRERRAGGTARSVVLGGRLGQLGELRPFRGEEAAFQMALAFEATGAWIRQRTGHTDLVPSFRVFFSLGRVAGSADTERTR